MMQVLTGGFVVFDDCCTQSMNVNDTTVLIFSTHAYAAMNHH